MGSFNVNFSSIITSPVYLQLWKLLKIHQYKLRTCALTNRQGQIDWAQPSVCEVIHSTDVTGLQLIAITV